MRGTGRRRILAAAVFAAVSASASAGAPDLQRIGACPGVDAAVDENLPAAARIGFDNGALVIAVNPFRHKISSETLSWLFFRQCALADTVRKTGDIESLAPFDHEYANCAAVRLMNAGGKIDGFTLDIIVRDVEGAGGELRNELGGASSVDLKPCL